MENLVYWRGEPVGIEASGRISWFPHTPTDIIESLTQA